jgi:hypothetical protein
MAIMKTNYVCKDKKERAVAKDFIRYIEYRPGRDQEAIARPLFGEEGAMGRWQAFRFVDEAPKGRYFYRIVVSPDPVKEDQPKDLPLRELIKATMQVLQERRDTRIAWVAAIHDDHTDKRHIHALAVVKGRLKTEEIEALRDAATAEAVLQREARNLMRDVAQVQREREEAAWAFEPEREEDLWAR